MRRRKTNSITYGALICAMVGALLTVNRFLLMGELDLFLYWIIPLPVIVYCVKFGVKDTVVMGVAMVIVSFICAMPTTVVYVVASVIAGIIYGKGLLEGKSGTYLIVTLILVSLIVAVLTTFVFAAAFGYSLTDEIEYYKLFMSQYGEKIGMDFASFLTTKTLISIIVLSTILTSVMEGILVHIFAYLVMKKLRMPLPPMKSVGEIECPLWLKIYLFITLVAYYGTRILKITQYDEILVPVYTISMFVFAAFGYMTVVTYMSLLTAGNRKKGAINLLVGLSFFLLLRVYVIIGVIDLFTNNRVKLIREVKKQYEKLQQENKQENN